MTCRKSPLLAVGIALLPSIVLAQSTSSSADQTPVIRATTREVLVDFVARDKHRHLITDLKPHEVQLFEDGVPQRIKDFRNVAGSEQLQNEQADVKRNSVSGSSTTASPLTSVRQVNFVAIVLADIAPLNLQFAREAVHDFLNSENLPNTYVSIYRQSKVLRTLQFYTANKELLAKAVDNTTKSVHGDDGLNTETAVIGASFASLQATAEKILSNPTLDPSTQLAVRNALLTPFPSMVRDPLFARDAAAMDVSVTLGNAILAQARIENGLKFATSLVNGMDSLDSLREIVRSQENLPGRKVVLYLSDGLDFPINRRDAVESLISYANRSGVSFYTVDTRGLKFEDPMMRSLAELQRTSAVSSTQRIDPVNGHKEDDDIQVTISSNRQLSMRELAEATGGFPIANTNEIAAPMQRVMEDIRSHYELAYTPIASNYDGRFRSIEVRVNRPHVTIQTRKGYFAFPDVNGKPLQPFEANALKAINARSSSKSVQYNLAVMKFRPREAGVEHQVAFEIPVSSLRATSAVKGGKPAVRASILGLIRNEDGDIIEKVGREITRDVDDSSSIHKDEHIVYGEPITLNPGHYLIDAAVTDEQTGETGVKRMAFYVPPTNDFGLSSLELVRDRNSSSAGPKSMEMAVLENRALPILSSSVPSSQPLYLFFVVYPAKDNSQPEVSLEMLHEGKLIARKAVALPQAASDGSIPVMLKIEPQQGHCDILVTAKQDTAVTQSSLSVNVN